jgi:RNA polymerase sigma-70 factor (ECF subfamily)
MSRDSFVRPLPLVPADQAGFRAVFEQHYPLVRRLLLQLVRDAGEADDLAQEVFVSLLRHELDPAHAHDVRRWLLRVALNRGLNALRGRRRREAREQGATTPDTTFDLENAFERHRARASVREVLTALEPRAAKLLMLRQVGLSYGELAEVIDVAPGSIGTLLVRAQRAFMAAYRERYGDEAMGDGG